MATHSAVYEQVLELINQLVPEEQQALIAHLQEHTKHAMSTEEFRRLFEATIVDLGAPVPDFSFRRQDWYDDDGR